MVFRTSIGSRLLNPSPRSVETELRDDERLGLKASRLGLTFVSASSRYGSRAEKRQHYTCEGRLRGDYPEVYFAVKCSEKITEKVVQH